MTGKRGVAAKKAGKKKEKQDDGAPRIYDVERFHTVAHVKVHEAFKANAKGLSLDLSDIQARAVIEFQKVRAPYIAKGEPVPYVTPTGDRIYAMLPPAVAREMEVAAKHDNVSERKFLFNAFFRYYRDHLGGE